MNKDRITSALTGLVGACNNNPKTANTDSVVIKALAFPIIYNEIDDKDISGMIDEIYLEKNAIAPNCANCTSPCGNTSDYDMDRIYSEEPEIRDIKLELLSKCQSLAAYIYKDKVQGGALFPDYNFFYKALSYISCDIEKEMLAELVKEIEIIEQKTGNGGFMYGKKNYKN